MALAFFSLRDSSFLGALILMVLPAGVGGKVGWVGKVARAGRVAGRAARRVQGCRWLNSPIARPPQFQPSPPPPAHLHTLTEGVGGLLLALPLQLGGLQRSRRLAGHLKLAAAHGPLLLAHLVHKLVVMRHNHHTAAVLLRRAERRVG